MKIKPNNAYVMRVISTRNGTELKIVAPDQKNSEQTNNVFAQSPVIILKGKKAAIDQFKEGDTLICDLTKTSGGRWTAFLLGLPGQRMVGRLGRNGKKINITPSQKNATGHFMVDNPHLADHWDDGILVEYELTDKASREGTPVIKINRPMAEENAEFRYSDIAIIEHSLRTDFNEKALAEADQAQIPSFANRVDLTKLPLVTIDGEDARDFDDAVYARPDENPANVGGWRAIVAIADVAYYVRPNSALDEEAYERGNSVYFPDRVLPMLPEALSNGLCSLKPDELRACVFVEMTIDRNGHLRDYKFNRGIMKSHARLTYEQVQTYHETGQEPAIEALPANVIENLYGVYGALKKARDQRKTLDIGSSERSIRLRGTEIEDVKIYQRHDSHKLIEELMIAANVATASFLGENKHPALYRIHEKPDTEHLERMKGQLTELGFTLKFQGEPTPEDFNRVLRKGEESTLASAVRTVVAQMQKRAIYTPENQGHYGLQLAAYSHFTSPIRRYPDLIIHRALISALGLEDTAANQQPDGLDDEGRHTLHDTANHCSATERRADMASKETSDRIAAAFLQNNPDRVFNATVLDVVANGFFANLDDIGLKVFVSKEVCDKIFGVRFSFNRQKRCLFSNAASRSDRYTIEPGVPVKLAYHEADTLRGRMSCKPTGRDAVANDAIRFPNGKTSGYTPL